MYRMGLQDNVSDFHNIIKLLKMDKENIRNLSFYCIFTRNHSESGTFKGVINDLPR
jgi:hypothetical protein